MRIPLLSVSLLLALLVIDRSFASLLEVSTPPFLYNSMITPKLTSLSQNRYVMSEECNETDFHLWSSEDSTRAGTAGIKLLFHYSVTEIEHNEGSCDIQDAESKQLLCRPGPEGYAWFRFKTDGCLSHFHPTEHRHDDYGWTVMITDSGSAAEPDVILNGKSLKDPLNPDIDTTALEQSEALSILKKIIQKEREKEAIEAEVKATKKTLLDLLEKVNTDLWRQSDSNPGKTMAKRRKNRKKIPAHQEEGALQVKLLLKLLVLRKCHFL